CAIGVYYKSEQCSLKKKCMQPDKTNFKCPSDMEMEATFITDEWKKINGTRCDKNKFIVIDESARESDMIPLLFRCIKDAVCEANVTRFFNETACHKRDVCEEPTVNTTVSTLIDCPPSHSLEALPKGTNTWIELNKIECYNEKILPYQGANEKSLDDFELFRCRKKNNCSIDEYYQNDCADSEVCTKPDNSSFPQFACGASHNFQMKTSEIEEWKRIASLSCKDGRFKATVGGGEESVEVPINFRCKRDSK
ncbi:hypothetical protein PFISCL1PPCAC_7589, partial [Pristionchus fissidentatus]